MSRTDFNKDFDKYIERRKNKGQTPFFKAVESLIPKRKSSKKIEEFDDDNYYPNEKEKKSFLTIIFRKFYTKKNNDYEDDMEPINKTNLNEDVEEIEEEIEEVNEEVEELQEKREGLFKRLFSMIFGSNQSDEDEDIDPELVKTEIQKEQESLKHETRVVLKLIHKWISKLSPEHIDAFRRSPDFVKYKDLLEKYDLIRKE